MPPLKVLAVRPPRPQVHTNADPVTLPRATLKGSFTEVLAVQARVTESVLVSLEGKPSNEAVVELALAIDGEVMCKRQWRCSARPGDTNTQWWCFPTEWPECPAAADGSRTVALHATSPGAQVTFLPTGISLVTR